MGSCKSAPLPPAVGTSEDGLLHPKASTSSVVSGAQEGMSIQNQLPHTSGAQAPDPGTKTALLQMT